MLSCNFTALSVNFLLCITSDAFLIFVICVTLFYLFYLLYLDSNSAIHDHGESASSPPRNEVECRGEEDRGEEGEQSLEKRGEEEWRGEGGEKSFKFRVFLFQFAAF